MNNKKDCKLGQKLPKNGSIVITDRGRFMGDIGGSAKQCALILCTLDELAQVVKKARQFQRNKWWKEKGGLHFTHLSPDVSFGFLDDANHPWLNASKLKKKGKKNARKTKRKSKSK